MPTSPRSRLPVLAALSAGLAFASSCLPLLATTVASLGAWAFAAIGASGALVWLVSRVYGELAGIYPTAAGVRTYVGQAFGERRGLWLALLYLFLVVGLGAAEAFVFARVLSAVFPALPPLPLCLGFVGACAVANVLGIEPAGKLQVLLTGGLFAGLAALALTVVADPHALPVEGALPAGFGTLAGGLAGAIFLFVGFEWVVSAVEEVDPEARALPRAMSWSVAALALIYSLLALAFRVGLGHDALASGVTQHLALGAVRLGRPGLLAAAALSTAATVTCFNGGILGASRLCYALAREGVLPRPLATLGTRFLTPWVAILAVSAVTALSAALLATTGAVKVPILVGAAIECAVYAAVSLAFARLRAREPERARPYRAPFGRKVATALAIVFAGLSAACVVGAGEWAPATGASLGLAVLGTGLVARRARRSGTRRAPRGKAGWTPVLEVSHG
jgi:amino acid transporter